jgi:hypothetical protein
MTGDALKPPKIKHKNAACGKGKKNSLSSCPCRVDKLPPRDRTSQRRYKQMIVTGMVIKVLLHKSKNSTFFFITRQDLVYNSSNVYNLPSKFKKIP